MTERRLAALLRGRQDINSGTDQWTALHHAVYNNDVEDVKLLLALPAINVNVQNIDGHTPLSVGCYRGRVDSVCVLLKDPRVDATLVNNKLCTPLWQAANDGSSEAIEWLIASGKNLGDLGLDFEIMGRWSSQVKALLKRFVANPAQTRHEIQVKHGVISALAAEVFALMVFLCDNLLQLKSTSRPAAARFFRVAKRLPMELQMMLCHRVFGSMKQNIRSNDSEAAFKSLAQILILSGIRFQFGQ